MRSYLNLSLKVSGSFLVILFLLSGSGCKPMCPIATCEVRMVHRHGKGEFRGSKWFKKQNPKIGEKLPPPTVDKQNTHNDKRSNRK